MPADIRFPLVLAYLIMCVMVVAGCSNPFSPVPTPTQQTTPTPSGAKYAAGDIIARTSTSEDPLWLIITYDPSTDQYERASIYKNANGGWGHRIDAKTEKNDRKFIERLYPLKIAHVSVSAIPITTVTVTALTTVTTGVTTTVTTASLPAPTVLSITPYSGSAGTTVNITNIGGTGFRYGATAKLVRGVNYITGSRTTTMSSENITCRFVIASYAESGDWDVTVTNPDGQSGTLRDGFTITNETTTTTQTTAPPSPTISFITPPNGTSGTLVYITNLAGTNFYNIASIKLRRGSVEISGTNISVSSSTVATCTFNLAGVTPGSMDVVITNAGSMSGVLTNGFTVI